MKKTKFVKGFVSISEREKKYGMHSSERMRNLLGYLPVSAKIYEKTQIGILL
jgi:hypothetical protein